MSHKLMKEEYPLSTGGSGVEGGVNNGSTTDGCVHDLSSKVIFVKGQQQSWH